MYRISIVLFCTLPLLILAQNKSDFDLTVPKLAKTAAVSEQISPAYLLANSEFVEISLTKEGYFTIGTWKGFSDSNLDDHCQITFGHPFAMTSYPVFSLDGSWYNMADYFSLPDSVLLLQEASSLMVSAQKKDGLRLSFSLVAQTQEPAVEIFFSITNSDTIAHTISAGCQLDPALGKWGDGVFFNGQSPCERDTIMTGAQANEPLQIWEKNSGAKGIGSEFSFTSGMPDKIILANWPDIYDDDTPEFQESPLRELYDLVLKIFWPSVSLAAGEAYEIHWKLVLVEPDFSSKIFMRWDIPDFLSMHDGIMFPKKMNTVLEMTNTTNTLIENANLSLEMPSSITAQVNPDPVDLEAGMRMIQAVDLNARFLYENKVITLSAGVYEGEVLLEQYKHRIFIPAVPVSDTGLVITNDSLSTVDFPEIDLAFSVEKEATGQRLFDIDEENIFLYENNIRLQNFSVERYSGGGSTLADVVFVLDVSGSMGDEKDQVVAYLGEFADSLMMRGYDFRIGLVTFSTTIDQIVDLTTDVDYIKQVLSNISLWGGIEDSPLALYTASELSFRQGSRRNIIWITDEPYPEDTYTVEQVVNRMLSMEITVHGVGLLTLQTDSFNPIVLPTGGKFYDIAGNFRDILLDVSRLEGQDRFLLSYQTNLSALDNIDLRIEIHSAGLGVIKSYTISPQSKNQSVISMLCYPNPFNPVITLQIHKDISMSGELSIFNILGQRIKMFSITKQADQALIWDGRNEQGIRVGSGYYIVQLTLRNSQGLLHRQSERILYLK